VHSSSDTKTSRTELAVVIGIAAVALFGSLMVILSLGYSMTMAPKEAPQSPARLNYEQALAKRTRELPEVLTFLHTYPNVMVEDNGNSGTTAHYAFTSVKPYPYLEDRISLGLDLAVRISKIPDRQDIRDGKERRFGEHYYSVTLFCSPASLDDPQRSWFPDRLWQKSNDLCESEKRAMNSTLIQ